jgi:peptide/nickel transport system ATP-binding protein
MSATITRTADAGGRRDARPLLAVRDLSVVYESPRGSARAVDDLTLEIRAGEMFGLAGESGSGKSTLAHALIRLIEPPGYIVSGSIDFDGTDVLELEASALRRFRWERVSIVTQSAMNALNPVTTIRTQFRQTYQAHMRISRAEADERAVELLRTVGLPASRLDNYPHELSGGMRQRVVIALALALEPQLVIMDEPTTALDVVLQREIIDEIKALRERFGFAVLFITHDLALLAQICDRIAVMYAGRIVELGSARELIDAPKHPYSKLLLESLPRVSGPSAQLTAIQGTPPDLTARPTGCSFHPRCPRAFDKCRVVDPPLLATADDRDVACHLYGES